jgi:hypothetical protein
MRITRRAAVLAGTALALPALRRAQAQAQTLILGGSDAVGSIIDRTNAHFTRLVNERARGRLTVNFIQGEQLGNDVQVIEQMMRGGVHIYGDVLDWYANWVKDLSVLAWGFTFRDNAHQQRFIDSALFRPYAEELRARHNVRILAAAPSQPRVMFSKRPIASPADLRGLKMRVPDIRAYLLLWQTLGTQPARVAWGEVFLGLPHWGDRRGGRASALRHGRPLPPGSAAGRAHRPRHRRRADLDQRSRLPAPATGSAGDPGQRRAGGDGLAWRAVPARTRRRARPDAAGGRDDRQRGQGALRARRAGGRGADGARRGLV